MRALNLPKVAFLLSYLSAQLFTLSAFGVNPPDSVEFSFKAKFPQAKNNKWILTKDKSREYMAEFTYEREHIKAYFDSRGNFVESEKKIHTKQLPDIIIRVLYNQFQKYTISKCMELTTDTGEKKYKMTIKSDGNKTALLMSKQGNWVPIENY